MVPTGLGARGREWCGRGTDAFGVLTGSEGSDPTRATLREIPSRRAKVGRASRTRGLVLQPGRARGLNRHQLEAELALEARHCVRCERGTAVRPDGREGRGATRRACVRSACVHHEQGYSTTAVLGTVPVLCVTPSCGWFLSFGTFRMLPVSSPLCAPPPPYVPLVASQPGPRDGECNQARPSRSCNSQGWNATVFALLALHSCQTMRRKPWIRPLPKSVLSPLPETLHHYGYCWRKTLQRV